MKEEWIEVNRPAPPQPQPVRYDTLRELLGRWFVELTEEAVPSFPRYHAKLYLEHLCRRIIDGIQLPPLAHINGNTPHHSAQIS